MDRLGLVNIGAGFAAAVSSSLLEILCPLVRTTPAPARSCRPVKLSIIPPSP